MCGRVAAVSIPAAVVEELVLVPVGLYVVAASLAGVFVGLMVRL